MQSRRDRWQEDVFVACPLRDLVPDDHILKRVGAVLDLERFRKVLLRTVQSCIDAGLVDATTVHVDATLVRADVSWASLTTQYVDQVIDENADEDDQPPPSTPDRPGKEVAKKKTKKRSTTDPDATMATGSTVPSEARSHLSKRDIPI